MHIDQESNARSKSVNMQLTHVTLMPLEHSMLYNYSHLLVLGLPDQIKLRIQEFATFVRYNNAEHQAAWRQHGSGDFTWTDNYERYGIIVYESAAILSIIAYPEADSLFDMPTDQIRTLAWLGMPAATLLYHTIRTMRKVSPQLTTPDQISHK